MKTRLCFSLFVSVVPGEKTQLSLSMDGDAHIGQGCNFSSQGQTHDEDASTVMESIPSPVMFEHIIERPFPFAFSGNYKAVSHSYCRVMYCELCCTFW